MSQLSYRDFALLVREYFNAIDTMNNDKCGAKVFAEAAMKKLKSENNLRKHLESFTISETAELPFILPEYKEMILTKEEEEAAYYQGQIKKWFSERAKERGTYKDDADLKP